MRKPWFRRQNLTWCVTLKNGTVKTLGRDEHGEGRKNPPPLLIEKWHALERSKPKPKDRPFAELADAYLSSLADCSPKSIKNTKEHLEWFKRHSGRVLASELRADHLRAYLKTKDWAESTKATAVSKVLAALNHGVDSELIESHHVRFPKKNPRKRKPRFERRKGSVTAEEQGVLERAAQPYFRAFLIGLRESGCRPSELCGA